MLHSYFNCKPKFGGLSRTMYKIFVLYIMFYLYVKNDWLTEKKAQAKKLKGWKQIHGNSLRRLKYNVSFLKTEIKRYHYKTFHIFFEFQNINKTMLSLSNKQLHDLSWLETPVIYRYDKRYNKNLNKIQRIIIHFRHYKTVFGYTITQLLTTLPISLHQTVAFFV